MENVLAHSKLIQKHKLEGLQNQVSFDLFLQKCEWVVTADLQVINGMLKMCMEK